ncbi:MAG: UPF0182 family protein, partial [Dermabacter sp.]|nr:UPF0182 family protein [Dermabacter sp.]
MSFTNPFAGAAQPGPRPAGSASKKGAKKVSPLTITLVVIVALIVAFAWFAEVATSYMWFDQLGFNDFLVKKWVTEGILFLVGLVAVAAPIFVCLWVSHKYRPQIV